MEFRSSTREGVRFTGHHSWSPEPNRYLFESGSSHYGYNEPREVDLRDRRVEDQEDAKQVFEGPYNIPDKEYELNKILLRNSASAQTASPGARVTPMHFASAGEIREQSDSGFRMASQPKLSNLFKVGKGAYSFLQTFGPNDDHNYVHVTLNFENMNESIQNRALQIFQSPKSFKNPKSEAESIQSLQRLYQMGEIPQASCQISPNIYIVAGQTLSFAYSDADIQRAAAYIFKNVGRTPQEKLDLLYGLRIEESNQLFNRQNRQ